MLAKQIFEKIATGQKLSPVEVESFAQLGDAIQNLTSVIQPSGGGVYSQSFTGVNAMFDKMPTSAFTMWNSETPSVLTSTITFVPFVASHPSSFFMMDETDAHKIVPKIYLPGRVLLAFGGVEFSSDPNGRRQAVIRQFDSGGSLLDGVGLFSLAACPDAGGTYPFAAPIEVQDGCAYFKLYVYQTSGSTLTLEISSLSLAVLN